MREQPSDSGGPRVQVWVARLDEEPPTPAALAAVLTDEERHRVTSPWHVRRLTPAPGYVGAVAAPLQGFSLQVRSWTAA